MKKRQKTPKPLRSFNEYSKRFFPRLHQERTKVSDPQELGLKLATETFEKLKPMLKGV